jgi:hypothetical protein
MSLVSFGYLTNYSSFLEYYYQSFPATGSVSGFNENINIGKNISSLFGSISWDSVNKKITIQEQGVFEVYIQMRINYYKNGSSYAPGSTHGIYFNVGGSVVAKVEFTNALSQVTGFSNFPLYTDITSSNPETPPTEGPTIVNGGATPFITINSNYYFKNTFNLNTGDEIYLNTFSNAVYYGGFNKTYPQGQNKLNNIIINIKKVR